MSRKRVWIFDIDGTLADHKGHRSPFDETKVGLDKPIEPVFAVLRALIIASEDKIIFVSGRTEGCREETIDWLYKNINVGVACPTINVFMRKIGDHRNDADVKKEIYDTLILPHYDINGVFDDRMRVCRMLYNHNIFCFNVNQGLIEF